MHPTAYFNCQAFFDTYSSSFKGHPARVVEIGSQDVNGSLRTCCPASFDYCGVDFVAGKGVDVLLDDPYVLPFPSESVDIVISSSCFEHSEMFWVLFLEIMRILRPAGLFYLNVPSNGDFHRYPVDCWRFYPDSGPALVAWAKRNGLAPALLESYISAQVGDQWNDYVAVFARSVEHVGAFPNRILHKKTDFYKGLLFGSNDYLNDTNEPEDRTKLLFCRMVAANEVQLSAMPDDAMKLEICRKIIDNELKLSKQ
ncbi:MAG: methyltransferase domain-containing protein [Rhodocyclales bacterium]|nr:methyltransferase domain-containing protein [Rhodocyclales bacterium]